MNKLNYLIVAVLVFTLTVFSGCTLVTDNQTKYMSQTVAEVKLDDKNTLTVSMEEFLIYYSNYASSYVQNGSTTKEATEKVLDMIINRKLIVNHLKGIEGNALTTAEINDCWTAVYNYVYEKMDSYKDAIYSDWGLKAEDEEKAKEESNSFVGRSEYEHDYIVKNGELVKVEKDDESRVDTVINPNPFKSYFWQAGEENIKGFTSVGAIKSKLSEYSDGLQEEEMKRFVKDLKTSESYKKYNDNTSWAILERELKRVYDIQVDNKYIEKYQNTFEKAYTVSAEQVLATYKAAMKGQKELYGNDITAYNNAMKSDATSVYYHPTQGWFYVSHLLISYNDEQKAQITEWENQVKKGIITEEEKDANIETLRTALTATARDSEGKDTKVVKSAEAVLAEVDSTLAVYGSDTNARINAFTDLIYKYTGESSFLSRDYDYAIPLDKEYDSMVDEFATASRDLQKTGQVGTYSRLVYTQYGAHIIMYTGAPSNANDNIDATTIQDLENAKLKSSSTKNMLDLFISKVTKSDYNVQQEKLIDQLRDGKQITIYKTRLGNYLK